MNSPSKNPGLTEHLYVTAICQPQLPISRPSSDLKMSLLTLLMFLLFALPAQAIDVYVLSSGATNIDDHVKSTLEELGHNVHIGVQYMQLQGAEPIEGYDSVLFLKNANWSMNIDMPDSGQTALQQFISSGGGLVTGEWVIYHCYNRLHLQTLVSVLPARASDMVRSNNSPITYAVVEPNSILNSNVDSPFSFLADLIGYATESQLLPKPEAQVFYDSDSLGTGVVGWDHGDGRVISFSTVIGINELSNSNYSQLLSNALMWSAHQQSGTICTAPIPGDINEDCKVDFLDFAIMASHWLECNLEPESECWN